MSIQRRPFVAGILSLLAIFLLIGLSGCRKGHPAGIASDSSAPTPESLQTPIPFDQPDEAARFEYLQVAPVREDGSLGEIPYERYEVARRTALTMAEYSLRSRSVTPRSDRAQAEQNDALGVLSELGPSVIGGRTRALVFDPTNPNNLYSASPGGGVWQSTDGGATWLRPTMFYEPTLVVTALVLDPTNPNVAYAGTGEGFFPGADLPFFNAHRGSGIYKNNFINGGSWTVLANTQRPASTDFDYVFKIVVSRGNSQRVYAATKTGVFRSLDGGNTWGKVLDGAALNGCTDLAIQTDRPFAYVFAACGQFVNNGAIFRTVDSPVTPQNWQMVFNPAGMSRTTLALAPSNQTIIYALASNGNQDANLPDTNGNGQPNGLLGVFRSTTNGAMGSWTTRVDNTSATKLNRLLLTNPYCALTSAGECNVGSCFPAPADPKRDTYLNQGWYDNIIAVDPVDPNVVWAGGIDLFRSDDGGMNFGLASYWWLPPANASYAHADHHALAFHPNFNATSNQILFDGSDGGAFRTATARGATATSLPQVCANPTASSPSWSVRNSDYRVTQFYHGLPYPAGSRYFGGTQDNGTVRGSDATGIPGWTQLVGGDGGFVAIDPGVPNTLFAETPNFGLLKSTNGGTSFSAAALTGITDPSSNFLFITPYQMDPNNARFLWVGATRMFRTSNQVDPPAGMNAWRQASDQFVAANYGGAGAEDSGTVSAVAIAPGNPDVVVAGTAPLNAAGGWVHRTAMGRAATGATNWPRSRARTGYVSALAFDPTNVQIVYATYSTFNGAAPNAGHVFKSMDGGATWNLSDGTGMNTLPDIPVRCIVVNPANTQQLFVGTDIGLFSTTDGGTNWARETLMFNTPIRSLTIGRQGGQAKLFIFTFGRGAFRAENF